MDCGIYDNFICELFTPVFVKKLYFINFLLYFVMRHVSGLKTCSKALKQDNSKLI